MAVHGKNTKVYLNGNHVSEFFNNSDINATSDVADASVYNQASKKFTAGQKTGTLAMEGIFDGGSGAIDEILEPIVGGKSIWCIFYNGDASGKEGKGFEGLNTAYAIKSNIDDTTRISATAQSNVCQERIISLMTLEQKTTSGSTTSVDNATATVGGSAYIHVTNVTGTVEVKLEHSINNTDWDDLVSFVDVDTSNTAQRVEIVGAIRRYARVTYTIGGGENITMQVSLHRI